jgi:phospholipase A1
MKRLRVDQGKCGITIVFIVLLLSISTGTLLAQDQHNLPEGFQTENSEELPASDALMFSSKTEIATPEVDKGEAAPESISTSQSYLSKLWELDENVPRGKYVIMTHRSNYMLPFAYNETPNEGPVQEATGQDVKNTEIKLQISMKIKLWQDILGKKMDLWFGYTQRSWWQLYNFADSSPFRETNYEPEVLLNFRTDFRLLGMKARTIQVGVNHQSNGRSEPLSRSWNRVVGNMGLEKDNFVLLLKAWYRVPEKSEDDDNPDLDDYMGPGEIWGYYMWNEHRLGVMLRNNLKFDDNRGALQLEWAFPLGGKISGYIQYFRGYGESLLDYNHGAHRIGIGFILNDWS